MLAAAVAVALLAALAALQLCVAAGMPWGRLVWGGAHRVLPRRLRIGSAVSVLLYAAFAWLLLARAGALPGSDLPFVVASTWVLLAYFCLGIVMNLASRSRPERLTMTPACTLLAVATLIVALG
jgi:hypothetical protein